MYFPIIWYMVYWTSISWYQIVASGRNDTFPLTGNTNPTLAMRKVSLWLREYLNSSFQNKYMARFLEKSSFDISVQFFEITNWFSVCIIFSRLKIAHSLFTKVAILDTPSVVTLIPGVVFFPLVRRQAKWQWNQRSEQRWDDLIRGSHYVEFLGSNQAMKVAAKVAILVTLNVEGLRSFWQP